MTSGVLEEAAEASGKVPRVGFCEEQTDVFGHTPRVCLSGEDRCLCELPAGHH